MTKGNVTSWEEYSWKENVIRSFFHLSSSIALFVDTLTLGSCARKETEFPSKCLIFASCVLNYDDLIASIQTSKCMLTIENTWDEHNVLTFFLYYLFAFDELFLVGDIMLVNPTANMPLPTFGVNYILASLFDTLMPKLCEH